MQSTSDATHPFPQDALTVAATQDERLRWVRDLPRYEVSKFDGSLLLQDANGQAMGGAGFEFGCARPL